MILTFGIFLFISHTVHAVTLATPYCERAGEKYPIGACVEIDGIEECVDSDSKPTGGDFLVLHPKVCNDYTYYNATPPPANKKNTIKPCIAAGFFVNSANNTALGYECCSLKTNANGVCQDLSAVPIDPASNPYSKITSVAFTVLDEINSRTFYLIGGQITKTVFDKMGTITVNRNPNPAVNEEKIMAVNVTMGVGKVKTYTVKIKFNVKGTQSKAASPLPTASQTVPVKLACIAFDGNYATGRCIQNIYENTDDKIVNCINISNRSLNNISGKLLVNKKFIDFTLKKNSNPGFGIGGMTYVEPTNKITNDLHDFILTSLSARESYSALSGGYAAEPKNHPNDLAFELFYIGNNEYSVFSFNSLTDSTTQCDPGALLY